MTQTMNFRTILQHIKLYKGISYSPLYGNLSGNKGFAVSPYKEREQIFDFLDEMQLRDYFVSNLDLLALENHFLGAWVEKGKAYLDVSVFEVNELKARQIARNANQLAIFNLETLETIYINEGHKFPNSGIDSTDIRLNS